MFLRSGLKVFFFYIRWRVRWKSEVAEEDALCVGIVNKVSAGCRLSSLALSYSGCLPGYFLVDQYLRSVLGFVGFSYQTSCFPPCVETRSVGISDTPRSVFRIMYF